MKALRKTEYGKRTINFAKKQFSEYNEYLWLGGLITKRATFRIRMKEYENFNIMCKINFNNDEHFFLQGSFAF